MLNLNPNSRLARDIADGQFLAHALLPEMLQSCLSIGLRIRVGEMKRTWYGKHIFVEDFSVPAHSIVQAFPMLLACRFSTGPTVNIIAQSAPDTGNASRSLTYTNTHVAAIRCNATAGTLTNGIVLGTGVTAIAMTDFAIQTLIAEGVGAGQMNYGAVLFAALGVSGSNRLIDITRVVTNNSGGAINVKESALYGIHRDSSNADRTFCLAHDALVYTHDSGAAKTIKYEFTVALT